MMNVYGLISSYLLIFMILGIATFLQSKNILKEEGARKFIHIGVSNWWILAMIFFEGENAIWFAIIAPATFIVLNYLSYRLNILKAMERNGKGSLGTVYFPISLLILVIVTYGILGREYAYIGGIGILIMGYGDGLAAVIGTKYGKHKLKNGKSLEGSLTMFVTSLVVSLILLGISSVPNVIIYSLAVASISTIIEYFTTRGLDNLTVPLGASLFYYLLTLI
jgi:phytol kinase